MALVLRALLCVASSAWCVAQTAGDAATFRRHLHALTAPEMGGRGTGTPGGLRAIEYLVAEFERLGLERLGGERLQRFSVNNPVPRRPLRESTFAATRAGQPLKIAFGEDVTACGFSPDGCVAAGVAFVGYGLRDAALGVDDYRGVEVRGKVVVILRGAPRGQGSRYPFRKPDPRLSFTTKISHAKAAGALAVMFVDSPAADATRDDKPPRIAATAVGEAGVPVLWLSRSAARRLFASFGLDARQSELDAAGVQPLPPHKRARLLGPLPDVQIEFLLSMQTIPRELSTANVLGSIRGCDPELAGEYVVLGAHHDHLGRGEFGSLSGDVGALHPGADDNASGVAAMLCIAERLVRTPARRSIALIAFGGEELQLKGSLELLRCGPLARSAMVAMINLDMIGRATGDRLRVEGVGSAGGFGALVAAVAGEVGVAARVRELATPRSDHFSFLRAGVPALFVHSGLHEQYHRSSDVAAFVDVDGALGVTALVTGLVERLANADARPEFVPGIVRRSFVKRRKR